VGLDILKDMLSQFAIYPDRVKASYETFYVVILVHVLTVVADRNQIKIAGC
uniref:Exportin-1 C-terminal domain-containing protein n=1 Tax=Parascaris univalens TaxID=6257 RepID=A0A915A367_PARUN